MCGRYAVTRDPATLAIDFDAVDTTGDGVNAVDYNVAPSKDVVTVVQRHPRDAAGAVLDSAPAVRSLRMMRWGLVPFWAKDSGIGSRMINTRAETAAEKPAFRNALARRRCLIPAHGWFEWRSPSTTDGGARPVKEPFFMTPSDGSSLAFAGLWETWHDPNAAAADPPLITCSVLTTDAVGPLTDIHHRMPLLLPATEWPEWLDPDNTDAREMLHQPPRDLVDSLELRPVSTRVNSVRNNGPELIERIDPAPSEPNALFDLSDG